MSKVEKDTQNSEEETITGNETESSSTDSKETSAENGEAVNSVETEEEPKEELSDLEKKDIEYKELHGKYLRLYSEFDNFRKRTAKEKIDLTKTASENVLKDLLPVLDDFDRAITNNDNVDDPASLKEGFGLIHNKLFGNLSAKGLKSMESHGELFDVDKHEALTNVPAPTEEEKGKVIDVIEKGYLLNDKVIRFAKVVVGQ